MGLGERAAPEALFSAYLGTTRAPVSNRLKSEYVARQRICGSAT
jgi:hypothetical protein